MADINQSSVETRVADIEATQRLILAEIQANKDQNLKQTEEIKALSKKNGTRLKSSLIAVSGGLAAIMVMMTQIDLKSEIGARIYEDFSGNIFEIVALIITVGSGYAAIKTERDGES